MNASSMKVVLLVLVKLLLAPCEGLDRGEIKFYKDENKRGDSWVMYVWDYVPQRAHRLWTDEIRGNQIESIEWNLPKGYAVTVFDEHCTLGADGEDFGNRHCENGYTLIGEGYKNSLDELRVRNNIEWFTVFKYSPSIGYVTLYDGDGKNGQELHIFPEFYSEGEVVSMGNWDMNDRVNGMDFEHLGELIYVDFYRSTAGGQHLARAYGWRDDHDHKRLQDSNRISSFIWHRINPIKADIDSYNLPMPAQYTAGKTYSNHIYGFNEFPVEQLVSVEIAESKAHTLESTITKEFASASSISVTTTTTVPISVFGIKVAETENVISLAFEYKKTETYSKTETTTTTTDIYASMVASIPNESAFDIKFVATLGELPETSFEVDGTFWYDIELPESTRDGELYYRKETIKVKVKGDAGLQTYEEFN